MSRNHRSLQLLPTSLWNIEALEPGAAAEPEAVGNKALADGLDIELAVHKPAAAVDIVVDVVEKVDIAHRVVADIETPPALVLHIPLNINTFLLDP